MHTKHLLFTCFSDLEVPNMKRVLESLASSNDEKVQCDMTAVAMSGRCSDLVEAAVTGVCRVCVRLQERRIKELEESLAKCQKVQEQVEGQCVFTEQTQQCWSLFADLCLAGKISLSLHHYGVLWLKIHAK